jgi:hypothetical protein
MKLEVGMYVRTKDGIIDKVIIDYNGHCASPNCECKHISCAKNYYDEDKIVRASYDIIDILEVGDYANGVEITEIYEKGDSFRGNRNYIFKEKIIEVANDNYETIPVEALFTNNEIETIVTKEQFEQMAYKVGE